MTSMGRSGLLLLCAFLLLAVANLVTAQPADNITEVTVQRMSGDDLILGVGSQGGVRIGDQYEVIRERTPAGMGQYDQIAVIEIIRVIEDGSRAKVLRKTGDVTFRAGDVLTIRWLVPGTVSADKNQRLIFSLQFGKMFYTDDAKKLHCYDYGGDGYEYRASEYELSWFWGGSLGIQVSKRFDILGTFTMTSLKEDYSQYSYYGYGDEQSWEDSYETFTYSTSLNTRITIYRAGSVLTFGKIGGWLLIEDDSASEIGFGSRVGLGVRWEMSRVFALGVEVDALMPFTPDDAFGRISIAVVPEFTLVSF